MGNMQGSVYIGFQKSTLTPTNQRRELEEIYVNQDLKKYKQRVRAPLGHAIDPYTLHPH